MDAEALRQLLISRREIIDPEGLGFKRRDPRGRKTPGLSQDHMDQLLMRSAGTYGKLERGVLENPSYEYLRDVSEILGLTAREWLVLYAFARGGQPPAPPERLNSASVSGDWKQLLDVLPLMACITDSACNVLAYNPAFSELFPRKQVPHNTPYWMLFSDEARNEVLTDWEGRWAPFLVGGLRMALALHGGDRTLVSMGERCQADPFLGRIYAKGINCYATPKAVGMPIRHPVRGAGTITALISELQYAPHIRLHVWLFHPEGCSEPELAPLELVADRDPAGFFPRS
ncbi:helix-turn-helix domain-containing protein [Streptomyces syringium]|uniref:helix-turn-helix domain-containing protein n=1 Tax=Streptomyces syringium TaxID=76729 RepID=UPI0033FF330D